MAEKLTLNTTMCMTHIYARSHLTYTPCSFIVNTIQTEMMNDKIQYKLDGTHSHSNVNGVKVESVHATHKIKREKKNNSKGYMKKRVKKSVYAHRTHNVIESN